MLTSRGGPRSADLVLVLGLAHLLGVSAASATTSADCIGIAPVWPPSELRIPLNPLVVLGTCSGEDLSGTRPMLVADRDRVPLRFVERVHESAFAFEPERLLRPATRYEVSLSRSRSDSSLVPDSWVTVDRRDDIAPEWMPAPTVSSQESRVGLDGETEIVFEAPVAAPEEVLAVLIEIGLEPNAVVPVGRRFLVPVELTDAGPRIRIRAGKLSPSHEGARSGDLAARLTILDLAGNRSSTAILRFRVPEPPPILMTGQVVTSIEPPVHVRRMVEPRYPELARKARIFGDVIGQLIVDATGEVREVVIEKGLPLGLTESALEGLRQWRFHPTEGDERTVRFTTHFLLEAPVYDPEWNLP